MGKLILCSGARTTRPYIFTRNGIKIYSMEELCVYLYRHIHLIEESMIGDALFDFIAQELKLEERAAKLRLLKSQKADLKTLITFILCSTDYYTEQEIKFLLRIVDEVSGLPFIKRNIIKADCFLREGQYGQAIAEYDSIINSPQASELTPQEYGDVYHNLAVAKVHVTGLKEASRLFHMAYERNQKPESLKQYLISLLLMNKKNEYDNRVEEYQVSEEMNQSILSHQKEYEGLAENTDSMKKILHLKELRNDGKMNEFYQGVHEMIELWKDRLREQ